MGVLLTFNIRDPEKQTAIRLIALRHGLKVLDIAPSMQNCTIEELLQGKPMSVSSSADTFFDEMLLMHALPPEVFHYLLDTLRQEGQSIRLKAVVTEHNRSWTATRLHRELLAEEQAFLSRKEQRKTDMR